MDTLNWKYDGRQYLLETSHGNAIIEEVPDETKSRVIGSADHNKYLPRLELNDGTVRVPTRFREFDDFETAEAFLLYHELAPLASRDQLSETLQECANLLITFNLHPTHLQRLHFLAKTLELSEPTLGDDNSEFSAEERDSVELSWQKRGSRYSADTHHGTAIIVEQQGIRTRHYGGSDSYKPLLTHSTGAALRGARCYTFDTAEEWITSTLRGLDHPMGGKADIDNVTFTLDICVKLLPEDSDSDPSHYVRIRRMQADYSAVIL